MINASIDSVYRIIKIGCEAALGGAISLRTVWPKQHAAPWPPFTIIFLYDNSNGRKNNHQWNACKRNMCFLQKILQRVAALLHMPKGSLFLSQASGVWPSSLKLRQFLIIYAWAEHPSSPWHPSFTFPLYKCHLFSHPHWTRAQERHVGCQEFKERANASPPF